MHFSVEFYESSTRNFTRETQLLFSSLFYDSGIVCNCFSSDRSAYWHHMFWEMVGAPTLRSEEIPCDGRIRLTTILFGSFSQCLYRLTKNVSDFLSLIL